jgi:opacity protein-like surface antigen
MKVQRTVIVIVSLFTASLAHAQYWSGPPGGPPSNPWAPWPAGMGPYFRMGVGPTFFQDSQLKSFSVSSFGFSTFNGPSTPVKYDVGVSFNAAFGWAFNRYVALDFDTGYVWAQMNSASGYFVNNSSMANVPFLGNVTLSLPIPHSNVVPYIGGGAGGSDAIFDAHNFTFNSPSAPFVDGTASDVVFAYQAFGGVRFLLGPNVSLGVGYRYFATGNPTFSGGGASTEFQGVRTHTVMFTFQLNF